MPGFEVRFHASILPRIRLQDGSSDPPLFASEGRLFLESCAPDSSLAPPVNLRRSRGKADPLDGDRRGAPRHGFLSVSLSVKGSEVFVRESAELLGKEGVKRTEEAALERKEEDGVVVVLEEEKKNGIKNKSGRVHGAGTGAMNTTKHLWAGAVAAMVSRY